MNPYMNFNPYQPQQTGGGQQPPFDPQAQFAGGDPQAQFGGGQQFDQQAQFGGAPQFGGQPQFGGHPQFGGGQQFGGQPNFNMQGNFPQMPQGDIPMPQNVPFQGPQAQGQLPTEESYIENILRLNKGKLATVYMTFENNKDWNALTVKGIIEAAGRDHLIISDPQTGKRYLFPMVYLDYITFDEEIEYEYPLGGMPGMSNYQSR